METKHLREQCNYKEIPLEEPSHSLKTYRNILSNNLGRFLVQAFLYFTPKKKGSSARSSDRERLNQIEELDSLDKLSTHESSLQVVLRFFIVTRVVSTWISGASGF